MPTDVTATEETTALEETTVLQEEGGLEGPPDSMLSYGGREVMGTIGTYSWADGDGGIIADSFAIVVPPKKHTLTVPYGSPIVFHYGSKRAPNRVGAAAYPLHNNDSCGHPLCFHRSQEIHGSRAERTIPAELQPGEYVVYVPVTEPHGQIDYTFRVMVR
jgi:hypothetical protein